MALLPLESPVALTAEQRACLADLAIGPLRVAEVWEGDRRWIHYAREHGRVGHSGGTLYDLARLGFIEPGPDFEDFVITEAGRRRAAAL